MLSSLLADFVCLCLPGPQQRLYRCQNNAGGRAMVCRDCCDHWQVVLMLFVMIIPKIDFSLIVVFSTWCCSLTVVRGVKLVGWPGWWPGPGGVRAR
jgi:hypothetical protein